MPDADAATLRLCIERCRRARDGRGAKQAQRLCIEALAPLRASTFAQRSIAHQCALAARQLGEWLRSIP